MQRRSLLRALAALVAGGLGAGCTNNREVPVTARRAPVTETDEPLNRPDRDATPPFGRNGSNGGNGRDIEIPGDNEGLITMPSGIETIAPNGTATDSETPTETETPTPTPTPTRAPGIENGGFDTTESDDGDLVVVVTVRNEADSERNAVVSVTAGAGDESYERQATTKVQPDEQREVRIEFPLDYATYQSDPSVTVTVREGTPTQDTTTVTGT